MAQFVVYRKGMKKLPDGSWVENPDGKMKLVIQFTELDILYSPEIICQEIMDVHAQLRKRFEELPKTVGSVSTGQTKSK